MRALEEARRRELERLVNPPLVLGRGYFMPSPTVLTPGTVHEWRPLGDTSRPLAKLVEAEGRIS